MKVIINKCHGGYGLSEAACDRYHELAGLKLYKTPSKWGGRAMPHYTTVPWDEYELVKGFDEKNNLYWSYYDVERNDPLLIQVVEELGKDADGNLAELKVVDIPDGVEYTIEEYDGIEHIAEKHRTWE